MAQGRPARLFEQRLAAQAVTLHDGAQAPQGFYLDLADALDRDVSDQAGGLFHQLAGVLFDREAECRCLSHRSENPNRIIRQGRRSAGADQSGTNVIRAIHGVVDGIVAQVQGNGIDGEIAVAQVLFEARSAIGGKIKIGEFQLESFSLKRGDNILITGPTTGVIKTKVEELRVDDQEVEEVAKGDFFSIPITEKIRPSDKLYKIVKA